jgi:hypothetical protein
MATSTQRNITRFDYAKTHGWWVRIRRGDRAVSRFFSDGIHGGKRAARGAALAFRDAALRRLGPIPAKRFRLCACGCGARVRRRYPSGRLYRFAPGCRPSAGTTRRKARGRGASRSR